MIFHAFPGTPDMLAPIRSSSRVNGWRCETGIFGAGGDRRWGRSGVVLSVVSLRTSSMLRRRSSSVRNRGVRREVIKTVSNIRTPRGSGFWTLPHRAHEVIRVDPPALLAVIGQTTEVESIQLVV